MSATREVADDELPVFWACGLTPQLAVKNAKPPLCITHAPSSMLITDSAQRHALPFCNVGLRDFELPGRSEAFAMSSHGRDLASTRDASPHSMCLRRGGNAIDAAVAAVGAARRGRTDADRHRRRLLRVANARAAKARSWRSTVQDGRRRRQASIVISTRGMTAIPVESATPSPCRAPSPHGRS